MSRPSSRSSTIREDSGRVSDIQPDEKQQSLGLKGPDLASGVGDLDKVERSDGKVELTEDDAEEKLGYVYPWWKKWMILVTILLIQVSMNSNAAMYGSGLDGISEKYGVTKTKGKSVSTAEADMLIVAARLGQSMFLIAYGFGCEFWAPWSEEVREPKSFENCRLDDGRLSKHPCSCQTFGKSAQRFRLPLVEF